MLFKETKKLALNHADVFIKQFPIELIGRQGKQAQSQLAKAFSTITELSGTFFKTKPNYFRRLVYLRVVQQRMLELNYPAEIIKNLSGLLLGQMFVK